eukprot:jgi/Mesvir1/15534/Mv03184-RA.1
MDRGVLTKKCGHLFCQECLADPANKNMCPLDRIPLDDDTLQVPLAVSSPITYRMLGKVKVRCPNSAECDWQGELSNENTHARTCKYLSGQQMRTWCTRRECQTLNDYCKRLAETNKHLETRCKTLEEELRKYKGRPASASAPPQGDPTLAHFDYNSCSPLTLGQWIAQFAMFKPASVNANHVYNKIGSLVADLQRFKLGAPRGDCHGAFYYEIVFLLSAALASNWFTDNQFAQLNEWSLQVNSW